MATHVTIILEFPDDNVDVGILHDELISHLGWGQSKFIPRATILNADLLASHIEDKR